MTAAYSAENPHAFYARLCAAGPVHKVSRPDGSAVWLITRYAEARAALLDPRLYGRATGPVRWLERQNGSALWDEPDEPAITNAGAAAPVEGEAPQSRFRRLHSMLLTPRRVARMRPGIQRIVDDLLDTMAERGRADLVADFSRPLAIRVIGQLLGIPDADLRVFQEQTDLIVGAHKPGTTVSAERHDRVAEQMYSFYRELIATKRARPDGSLLGDLVLAQADDPTLSDTDVMSVAFLLVGAGYDTVTALIGNGMLALLRHPEQLALLRNDPSLVSSAVNELLRHDGPADKSTWRFAAGDLRIGSAHISRGDVVVVAHSAANRDPRVFPAPETLDVRRPGGAHLGFGHGARFCVGARLAKVESEIAIGSLVGRFEDLGLAIGPDELTWQSDGFVRGVRSVPVRFTPIKAREAVT